MSRATEDALDALHGVLAESYKAELERLRAEGEGISPALLAAINKFLKDNGIDRPGRDAEAADDLAEHLPADLDEVIQFPGGR